MYICVRCLAVNHPDELRPGSKIGSLSAKLSRKHKQCKSCKCKVFYEVDKQ